MSKKGLLARNSLYNLLGQAVPLLFALAAIPFVVEGLGTDRYGVLLLIWLVIGYFGLFDMGLGRATTKFVADLEAEGEQGLGPFILTSILLLFGVGLLGCLLVVLITPWLVYDVLNIPENLLTETEHAFYILSASIPLVLGSVGARGALEAQQKFALVNAIKVPAGILNYLAPLLVLPFSVRLQPVVAVLLAGRALTFLIYTFFCFRPEGRSGTLDLSRYPVVKWIKNLFGYGAWITVSNLVSPIMVYMDRFIVGSILTAQAVAYYGTPYDVVTRLLIIPGSFMGVMFPAFSVASLEEQERELDPLYRKSIRYLLLALVPAAVLLIIAAEPLLYVWLGDEFAANSAGVLRLLAVGVLANAVAMVPYTALQAMGRPDVTAKLHMAELPLYLGMIWVFIHRWGIEGVALAWVLRVALDGGLLLFFYHRLISSGAPGPPDRSAGSRGKGLSAGRIAASILWGSVLAAGYFWLSSRLLLTVFALAGAAVTFLALWNRVLHEAERKKIFRLYIDVKRMIARGS